MPKLKNPKHESFAKNYIAEGFNGTKAYLKTYPNCTYENANSASPALVNSSLIQNRIQEIADKKGMTLDSLIDGLNETRQANKPITFNGDITCEYPDYAVRLEATRTGLKLHGALNSDSSVNNIDARSVNIQLDKNDIERLASVVSTMQSLRSSLATSNKSA